MTISTEIMQAGLSGFIDWLYSGYEWINDFLWKELTNTNYMGT